MASAVLIQAFQKTVMVASWVSPAICCLGYDYAMGVSSRGEELPLGYPPGTSRGGAGGLSRPSPKEGERPGRGLNGECGGERI